MGIMQGMTPLPVQVSVRMGAEIQKAPQRKTVAALLAVQSSLSAINETAHLH